MNTTSLVAHLQALRTALTGFARSKHVVVAKTLEALDEAIRVIPELERLCTMRGKIINDLERGHKIQLTQLQATNDRLAGQLAAAKDQASRLQYPDTTGS